MPAFLCNKLVGSTLWNQEDYIFVKKNSSRWWIRCQRWQSRGHKAAECVAANHTARMTMYLPLRYLFPHTECSIASPALESWNASRSSEIAALLSRHGILRHDIYLIQFRIPNRWGENRRKEKKSRPTILLMRSETCEFEFPSDLSTRRTTVYFKELFLRLRNCELLKKNDNIFQHLKPSWCFVFEFFFSFSFSWLRSR